MKESYLFNKYLFDVYFIDKISMSISLNTCLSVLYEQINSYKIYTHLANF